MTKVALSYHWRGFRTGQSLLGDSSLLTLFLKILEELAASRFSLAVHFFREEVLHRVQIGRVLVQLHFLLLGYSLGIR